MFAFALFIVCLLQFGNQVAVGQTCISPQNYKEARIGDDDTVARLSTQEAPKYDCKLYNNTGLTVYKKIISDGKTVTCWGTLKVNLCLGKCASLHLVLPSYKLGHSICNCCKATDTETQTQSLTMTCCDGTTRCIAHTFTQILGCRCQNCDMLPN